MITNAVQGAAALAFCLSSGASELAPGPGLRAEPSCGISCMMECLKCQTKNPILHVGILNAFHPADGPDIHGGSPVDLYADFLDSVNAPFAYVVFEAAQGQLPSSPDACDAYLITGSLRGAYDDDPWIAALSQFVRDSYGAGKTLVGICFGHQLLSQALGGKVVKSENGWGLGLLTFRITKPKPWMSAQPEGCSLYFAHQDQVTQLPPNAELLGGNAFCPNAFYSVDDRVLGIQGHPEFSPRIMAGVLAGVEELVEPQRYQAARQSLACGAPDNRLVARWVVDFVMAQADR